MIFNLKPKRNGKPLDVELPLNGSRQEAFDRAKKLAGELTKLLKPYKFTVLIERTDGDGAPYEVDADGHTVE